ncbi:SGNH/GDSL hydrolase family protein [Altericroceibacterium xinjiangense]|uniref:SGNH/GDSL hydrolase family protein n=1 Tax=Altericroceibacterium xinjiangense TaxID=762261 RepID=UPI0013E0C92C|nr:SGNH/GDSL hydrolase family protein [Altericroceibacterium xinjiangense]
MPVPVRLDAGTISSFTAFTAIAKEDRRVRLLGGRWKQPAHYPASAMLFPQAITDGSPEFDANGWAPQRYGNLSGIEFTLPAGQTAFELVSFDTGSVGGAFLEIDGKRTSATPFDFDMRTRNGVTKYLRFELPPANRARRLTLWTANLIYGGLLLPAGDTIGPAPANSENLVSVVFVGDSITEGSAASSKGLAWPAHAAARLGVRNPIVSAIGGTGYMARRADRPNTFDERLDDVLKAVDDGPPDALVIAGGANDCASYPPADIGDAAREYFAALRSAAPEMPIFVIAPFSSYTGVPYPAQSASCRDAIFDAAQSVPLTYTINTADWVTAVNRDELFDGARNGPHPVDAGHAEYGRRAAEAISSHIQAMKL